MDLNPAHYIKAYPDFPKPGIVFRDVSPLLASPTAFNHAVSTMAKAWGTAKPIEAIAGLDARGFIFGMALAQHMQLPFVMIRKKGKLPGPTDSVAYGLEYGNDVLEISKEALPPGSNVLIVDDLLATGGSAEAAGRLITSIGCNIAGYAFVIELLGLGGRGKLWEHKVSCLLQY
jgi:adenine phosphoribosyltransferase